MQKILKKHNYTEDGRRIGCLVIECVCGSPVYCEGFTNTCDDCGRDYNGSGQLLAPRELWGQETGESLGDILRIK